MDHNTKTKLRLCKQQWLKHARWLAQRPELMRCLILQIVMQTWQKTTANANSPNKRRIHQREHCLPSGFLQAPM